jgi:ferric enterobactin receptor
MILKHIGMLVLALTSTHLFAQTNIISGLVVDSASKQPLAAATVVAKDKLGNIVKSVSADKDGNFTINLNSTNVTGITVSFLQYNTKEIAVVLKDGKQYVGTILLTAKLGSLTEVIVKGKKNPLLFKIDKQVYAANKYTNAAGGTATDILRNLPSVTVNGVGDILFRGSTSFLVLINGKPTQGEPAFVLSQLPAGSVENIELITSPGAAYDADGKAGVINIITKNNVQDGWLLQANAMGGLPPLKNYNNGRTPKRYSFDVTTGFRKNKWDISAGINYLRNDIAGNRDGDVITIINNVKTNFPSYGERSFKRYNYGGRIAINFEADKNNNFSVGFYSGEKYQSRIADILYNNSRQNNTTGAVISNFTYFNSNDQQRSGRFTLASADYMHKFSATAKISFSALYERANLFGITYNRNLRAQNSTDTLQYTENPYTNPLDAYRIKADFTKQYGRGSLQAGYQFRYDVQDGNFVYKVKVLGTNQFVIDPLFTSNVKAANYIHAGYVQYSGAVNKLNYTTGVRLEQSERTLNFSANNGKEVLQLLNLFPSIQLRYKAWNKGIVKLAYNKRIKRTNNYELNPFPEREHSETLEQGDAKLLPELIANIEAGIEHSFLKGNVFATVYYQTTTNPIQRVNKVFNDTILNRVFTNAGKATQVGIEANINYEIASWWNTVVGGNMYKFQIKGNLYGNTVAINNSSCVYSINSTQSFSLPKNWSMQLSINYLSLRATAQGEDSYFFTPHFTVKKITANRRWAFQLQWLNMDAGLNTSNRQRITTRGIDFFTTTNYIYETDQLQLSVSFNISKKNRKLSLPQSEIGEKEF